MVNQLSKLPKPKISVALATFNEEQNIGSCLDLVKQLVDEIVVVDGSSSDKTVEIAKSLGAKVIVTTNPPIFHINKQKAIDKCRGKWILQLDADERVTPSLRDEILFKLKSQNSNLKTTTQNAKVKKSKDNIVAYYIPRKNYFLGKWLRKGGQYPDYVIRFFQRGKAYLPCKSVHEQMKVDGKIGYLKGHLDHYTTPNFSRYLTNANRYTSLTAQGMIDARMSVNLFTIVNYLWWKPFITFVSLFFRHKGFIDGWQGFVFAFFSGLHYPWAFIKYWRMKK